MKIKVVTLYSALFSILLLAQLYIPSFKVNMLLQLGVLVFFIFSGKGNLSIQFFKKIAPLCILFVLPFIVGLFHHYGLGNFLKDVFYFAKPIIGITLGYLFFKRINNFEIFLKTVILTGLVSAVIHFFILLFFTNFLSGNVAQIREFGKDNFLELFALFFLIYRRKILGKEMFKKHIRRIIFLILLISCLLYLSRTMLVVALIMFVTIQGYTKITRNTLSILGVFLMLSIMLYGYLYSINIKREADGIEGFLYKLKIAPAELFKAKVDRDDHRKLWDYWRAYEALRAINLMNETPTSYIIGTGFGSLVNLKFHAPLDDSDKGMKFISETHNGYIFTIYKSGLIGLMLMMYFLSRLYNDININGSMTTVLISGIALTFIFTTLTITGIFNKRDMIIFILGGLMYFQQRNNE